LSDYSQNHVSENDLETLFHEWLKSARDETVRWSESFSPAFLVETDDAIFHELRGIVGPVRFGFGLRAGDEAYNASEAYVYGLSNTSATAAAFEGRETWEAAYFATLVATHALTWFRIRGLQDRLSFLVIEADRHARIFSFREGTQEIAINRTLAPIIPMSGAGPIN
jgi:hypothetical protein